MTILQPSITNFDLNVSSCQHEIHFRVSYLSRSPDAISQQRAHSPAHPENTPGHMRVSLLGRVEGKKPEREQKKC